MSYSQFDVILAIGMTLRLFWRSSGFFDQLVVCNTEVEKLGVVVSTYPSSLVLTIKILLSCRQTKKNRMNKILLLSSQPASVQANRS